MASELLPQIGDFLSAFAQGRSGAEVGQERQTRGLQGQIQALPQGQVLGSEQLRQLGLVNPAAATAISDPLQALSTERQQALFDDASAVSKMWQEGFGPQGRERLVKRIDLIDQAGGDSSDSREILDIFDKQGAEAAVKALRPTIILGQSQNKIPNDAGLKSLGLSEDQRFLILQKPDGTIRLEPTGISPAGKVSGPAQVRSSKIGAGGLAQVVTDEGISLVQLSPEDQAIVRRSEERAAELQGLRAEERTRGTQEEKRGQTLINQGITAAESTAILRRGIELLGNIETGGIAAITLATKQRLGIEGADEGELSSSLGKAVLSQLRDTFGAAFTENEGARLERIEANIGKSTAANKRLLNQALRISERAAKRARKAAVARGDEAAVADIDDLLTFSLSIEPAAAQTPGGQATSPGVDLSTLSLEELIQLRQQGAQP